MSAEKIFRVEVRLFCLCFGRCFDFCLGSAFCSAVSSVRVNVVTGAHECWFG